MLAGKYCAETVEQRVSKNAVKSNPCCYCTEIPVSVDGLRRVADASEPTVMTSFFILPPIQKYFYKQTHADYVEPPVVIDAGENNMKFIYPADGATIILPLKPDGARSELICKAAHNNNGAQLFWHLDNNYVGSTKDIHQISIVPKHGVHRQTIIDNIGQKQTIEIVII